MVKIYRVMSLGKFSKKMRYAQVCVRAVTWLWRIRAPVPSVGMAKLATITVLSNALCLKYRCVKMDVVDL